ncbi:MAG: ROK family protein [Candidatus Omnitrophica bacterium]|nr:ROK family protein [Candidatus Omnitrophota bacterium]
MEKKAAIGVDIGGGSVKFGLVTSHGRVLERGQFPTNPRGGKKLLFDQLVGQLRSLISGAQARHVKVVGVGLGAPGPIDVERGFIYFFPNIPGWKNTPIRAELERALRRPVFVDNDANGVALAEFLYGAGKGMRNLIALTLGTGVGGGLVLNGRLFHGEAFSAAEIGHIVLDEKGSRCSCGNRGCLETYVGSGYFTAKVRRRLAAGEKSILSRWLKEGRELTPRLVAEAARKKDRFAILLWEETGERLGTALAGLTNVLNPDRIILGGGIAQNGSMIFDPVIRTLRKKAFPIAARSVRVVPAALGSESGFIGAAAQVFVSNH